MTNQATEQARRLAGAIVAQHNPATCEACLDQIEEYISAQLANANYATQFPAIAQHLDSCVDCAKSYALIYQARLAERDALAFASIPDPDFSVPDPDFSFLRAGTAYASIPDPDFSVPDPDFGILEATARLRKALANAVERTGTQLRLTLTQALLDALPRPQQLAPAMAYRSGEEPGIPLVELELDEPEDEITRLQLTAHPKGAPPTYCTIRVQLALQGREWPDLAEIPVILKLDNTQRLALTDAWGQVSFEDVPTLALPGLQIAVDTGSTPPIRA